MTVVSFLDGDDECVFGCGYVCDAGFLSGRIIGHLLVAKESIFLKRATLRWSEKRALNKPQCGSVLKHILFTTPVHR